MLSYQHEYHAGNHADVLKHCTLAVLIRALERKPAAFRVIDCHAGAGSYDLTSALTQRRREYESGAARVLGARDGPACVEPYLDVLSALNSDGVLRRYPGSPQLAHALLRPGDQLELFELHPRAAAALRALLGRKAHVHIHVRDAYEGVAAVLPPAQRRGLVLIDPSYERRNEQADVAELVAASHRRWMNGVLVIWYPILARSGTGVLLAALRRLALPQPFQLELTPDPQGTGLRGSGLVIVNLPYAVDAELEAMLAWLHSKLARHDRARWSAGWL